MSDYTAALVYEAFVNRKSEYVELLKNIIITEIVQVGAAFSQASISQERGRLSYLGEGVGMVGPAVRT